MSGGAGIGALVGERRRAAGLTQRQLAEAAGVSLGAVCDLEQGRTARPRSARRLAAVLGLRLPGLGESRPPGWPVPRAGAGQSTGRGGSMESGLMLRVLGPLMAWRGRDPLELGPPQQQAVLGLLALHPNTVVHRDHIVDALWGDEPPASARTMIQVHVSRLRRLLGPGRPARSADSLLVSAGAGYRLRADGRVLDLLAFGQLVRDARNEWAGGRLTEACDLFARSLGLWWEEPLAGIDVLRGHPAVAELTRRHAEAIEDFAEAATAAGRPDRALPHLRALTSGEPLNERAHARLMLALAATGRQAAALDIYGELRERLTGQLGIDPGAELEAAHVRVLRGQADPTRTVPVPVTTRLPVAGAAASASPAAMQQLPGATRHFVGRGGELAELTAVLDGAHQQPRTNGQPGVMVILAIGGTAGVGKTALALRWAHQVAGRFPDGQLFANLRGFDPARPPAEPSEVLVAFLAALGVPPELMPSDPDAQAARYRGLLAGRRVLVLLDNARDSDQVRPLLPATPGCVVMVTSRHALTGLVAGQGAHLLSLNVLSDAEAMSCSPTVSASRAPGTSPDPTGAPVLGIRPGR
jgi:DNA-binding SARP family transcriptional activator/transcriptional regulator with XRE-family HTH domain